MLGIRGHVSAVLQYTLRQRHVVWDLRREWKAPKWRLCRGSNILVPLMGRRVSFCFRRLGSSPFFKTLGSTLWAWHPLGVKAWHPSRCVRVVLAKEPKLFGLGFGTRSKPREPILSERTWPHSATNSGMLIPKKGSCVNQHEARESKTRNKHRQARYRQFSYGKPQGHGSLIRTPFRP